MALEEVRYTSSPTPESCLLQTFTWLDEENRSAYH